MSDLSHSVANPDSATFQRRALRQRQRYTRSAELSAKANASVARQVRRLFTGLRALPARYLLHLLVGLLIPLATLVSHVPLPVPRAAELLARPPYLAPADFIVPIAPLTLDSANDAETPVPDSAFADIDALPETSLRSELLRPQPIAATIIADSANVRGGPGTNYDKVGNPPAGASLQLLAQAGSWYQAREDNGRVVWIAAELLNLDVRVAALVPEAASIPAPPPARVGLVVEEGLNLRDGPGTTSLE